MLYTDRIEIFAAKYMTFVKELMEQGAPLSIARVVAAHEVGADMMVD